MPGRFCDDISNSSGVITSTNTQTLLTTNTTLIVWVVPWQTLFAVEIQGGPIKTAHFFRYHNFAATTDIITRFLQKCSEITTENNKRLFLNDCFNILCKLVKIWYLVNVSANRLLTILILKYATEFYHNPCMPY